MLEREASIAPKSVAAATDLLRRRIRLPNSFQFVLGEYAVSIVTDSALLGEALNCLIPATEFTVGLAHAEWEIAVETHRCGEGDLGHGAPIGPIEVERFGPSRSLRMSNGSWFAHTPPSLNGVGFAMIYGSERGRIDQLAEYLRAIVSLVDKDGAQSIPVLTLEVGA